MGIKARVYSASGKKEGLNLWQATIGGMESKIGSMSNPATQEELILLVCQVKQWVEIQNRRIWDKRKVPPVEDLRIKVELGKKTRTEIISLYQSDRTELESYLSRISSKYV